MNQHRFLLELVESETGQMLIQRLKRDQDAMGVRFQKNEHINISGGQRLAMKSGSGRTTDGIMTQRPVDDELFKDIADLMHDCLMNSSCRVS